MAERSNTIRPSPREVDRFLQLGDCFFIHARLFITEAKAPVRYREFRVQAIDLSQFLNGLVVLPPKIGDDSTIGLNQQGKRVELLGALEFRAGLLNAA